MHRERFEALRAARDAADDEHVAAIRFALNYISRLEKRLSEAHHMARAIARATTFANASDIDNDEED